MNEIEIVFELSVVGGGDRCGGGGGRNWLEVEDPPYIRHNKTKRTGRRIESGEEEFRYFRALHRYRTQFLLSPTHPTLTTTTTTRKTNE